MSDGTFSCNLCVRSFGSSNALRQHRRNLHPPTLPCGVCGRLFGSTDAVEKHTAASHPPVFECARCRKSFRTEAGCEEHTRVVHSASFECAYCNKVFGTPGGRDMHQRVVHEAEEDEEENEEDEGSVQESSSEWRPAAPIPTPGYWIARADFVGNKSFGYFDCDSCNNSWVSAHAFPLYRQGCKACEVKSLPTWLWVNLPRDNEDEEEERSEKEDKPHHRNRCDACKAGVCLA